MRRRRACILVVLALAGCTQPAGPELPISGEQLYNQYCARCHGVDGVPTPEAPTASSLADRAVVERMSDETMKGVIRAGRGQMPGFGERFTDATLQVFVAYVRSLPPATDAQGKAPPQPPAEAPMAPATP
jgi:mono/diheme cytochrome c family protein